MSYCINPWCRQRENPLDAVQCQSCGTPLLIDNRYRVLRSLRHGNNRTADLFEVNDCRDGTTKVLKVLISDDIRVIQLFQQEQRLLTQLTHVGIPKAEASYSVQTSNERTLRCLVMEKIPGQTLEQWLEQHGAITADQAVIWLEQLAQVLTFIHRRRLFHRDIKPSNVMLRPDGQLVLIDFGTAGQITEAGINGQDVIVIYSRGYTAPEQREGQAVLQSDFYALGRTMVHLLTGIHPASAQLNLLQWQTEIQHPVPVALVDLINDLMASSPQQRPRTAEVILNRLHEIQPDLKADSDWRTDCLRRIRRLVRRQRRLIQGVGLGVITMVIAIALAFFLQPVPDVDQEPPANVCDTELAPDLSCGERVLVPGPRPKEKSLGVKLAKQGDYAEAVEWLEQAWEKQRDPETLIYLNNARVRTQSPDQSSIYTIAVAVPLNDTPDGTSDVGLEILRGVAQAQDQATHEQLKVQVLLANDANQPDRAQQVAASLVKYPSILGVVGHYASEVTQVALETYRDHQLVVISPTSTSAKFSAEGNRSDHVFFRTVPSTRVAARAIADYLSDQEQKQVAIFYTPQSEFSRSLTEEFLNIMGKQVVEEFNLSDLSFNANLALQEVQALGATALALFPDGRTQSYTVQNALELIKANQGRLWIVGDNVLYTPEVLKLAQEQEWGQLIRRRFVVRVPWHPLSSRTDFPQQAQEYWREPVTSRVATAYDAAQALIAAIQTSPHPNRAAIQKTLADPGFKTNGATGVVRFEGSDRREPLNTLVKVLPNCSGSGYRFVPVNYRNDQGKLATCFTQSTVQTNNGQ